MSFGSCRCADKTVSRVSGEKKKTTSFRLARNIRQIWSDAESCRRKRCALLVFGTVIRLGIVFIHAAALNRWTILIIRSRGAPVVERDLFFFFVVAFRVDTVEQRLSISERLGACCRRLYKKERVCSKNRITVSRSTGPQISNKSVLTIYVYTRAYREERDRFCLFVCFFLFLGTIDQTCKTYTDPYGWRVGDDTRELEGQVCTARMWNDKFRSRVKLFISYTLCEAYSWRSNSAVFFFHAKNL